MKLPNWFKIVWWVAAFIGLGALLATKYREITTATPTVVDTIVAVVWLALLLLPLFQEISLFGLTFKKEFEALRTNIRDEISILRADVRTSAEVRNQVSASINLTPPPDSVLPTIERKIQAGLERVPAEPQTSGRKREPDALATPPDAQTMFQARYNIERELRRLWQRHAQRPDERRFLPTMRIVESLAEWELLDPTVERAVREVWRVASPAIHGEPVSDAKIRFVQDIAPRVVSVLKRID